MAVTPIGNTNTGGGIPGMDQIDQAFGKMYSMFGNATGGSTNIFGGAGGGSSAGGLQPQPVSAGNDDLTRYQRSAMNLQGTTAPGMIQMGGNLIGASMPITQGGIDMSGAGFGTTETALKTMQPGIDFYNKLASGDPLTMTQALSPTAQAIAQITAGATDQGSRGMAPGGYRAAYLSGLPFAQTAQLGEAAYQLQPAAAAALQQAGQAQAAVGGEQAQIGQGVAQTGLGVGQLGTVLTGQGLQTLQNTIADILQKMGINIQGGTAATTSQILGSL
jgi:hypothetical protein